MTNSSLEVTVTATDSRGSSTTKAFTVAPRVMTVAFDDTNVKVQMNVNGQLIWTRGTCRAGAGWELSIATPTTKGLYEFKRWSDASTAASRR